MLTVLYVKILVIFCCSTKNATSLLEEGGGSADFPDRLQKVTNSPPKGLRTTDFFFK